MSLRVAIFEPEPEGHHLVYVRHILAEVLRRGWQPVLVVTERVQQHPAYQEFIASRFQEVPVVLMPDTQTPDTASDLRRLKDQFQRRNDYAIGFAEAQKLGRLDACFMLNLDRADLPISLLGSPFGQTPFCGFLMGRQFHCPHVGVQVPPLRRRDKLAEPVFRRLLRCKQLQRVLSVDETLVDYAQKFHPVGYQKVVHVHDAAYIDLSLADDRARSEIGLKQDQCAILAYGSLSLRKGVAELIDALALPSVAPAATLVLAGKQDDEVKQLLQTDSARLLRSQGRLIELNRFIDERLEAQLFRASDAVWVGYRYWFGMSGVLMQAAASGKPLLAMRDGLVGYLTQHHELGVTVDVEKPAEIASAINQLVNHPELREKLGSAGLRYAEGRTTKAFASETCDHIQASL